MPSVINSDNGVISGTSGLKTSGSNDGLLDFQSNGTRIAGITTSAFQVGTNNISAVNSMGFRNRIINGDMRIDQRNAGASVSVSTSGVYVLDRWKNRANGGGVFSVQQSSTAPAGFTNSTVYTVTTADASIAAGDNYWIVQEIEGYNVADLGFGTANAQTITLSFWVRSSVTGTYSVFLSNATTFDRGYVATFTISSANTFEYKTITIAGDTSGTWGKINGGGLTVGFNLGTGTTYQTTAGAWAAGFFQGTSATTQWIGTNGATFYITGVQLEAGSVATPFERRDYGRELMMCQRYYCKTFQTSTAPAQNSGTSAGTICFISQAVQLWDAMWRFPVEMRVAPTTVTTYSPNQANANWSLNGDSPTASIVNTGSTGLGIRATTPAAAGRGYSIHASADAEL